MRRRGPHLRHRHVERRVLPEPDGLLPRDRRLPRDRLALRRALRTGALVCPAPPPAVLVIHGQKDTTVPYESTGKNTRDSWVYNDGCNATKTAAFAPSPCASYTTCSKNGAAFCGVPNLAHAVWSGAAAASWAFLSKL